VPVGDTIPPRICFSCGKEIQWQEINRATKGIAAINEASQHSEFVADIETEQL
jgi:DNA-directed RNA polymerase subunit N (RpoN/RPB10)